MLNKKKKNQKLTQILIRIFFIIVLSLIIFVFFCLKLVVFVNELEVKLIKNTKQIPYNFVVKKKDGQKN